MEFSLRTKNNKSKIRNNFLNNQNNQNFLSSKQPEFQKINYMLFTFEKTVNK